MKVFENCDLIGLILVIKNIEKNIPPKFFKTMYDFKVCILITKKIANTYLEESEDLSPRNFSKTVILKYDFFYHHAISLSGYEYEF